MKRRLFLKHAMVGAGALAVDYSAFAGSTAGELKISLAEWSLHRMLQAGKLDHLDFPLKAKNDFGIDAVEYVSGFFGMGKMTQQEAATNKSYLQELLQRSKDAGVYNHLIMIDKEGSLAIPNDKERLQAVESHKKWIDAAKFLGCATIRVNLHGDGETSAKKTASVDSLSRLGEYAAPQNINVVVENHGSDSSKGDWVASVMKQVNMKNVGTLPDFGNFCINHPWGTTQGDCTEAYDRYKGVAEMLPFAKGVSAKSYDFDADGNQPKIDFGRLIAIVKKSGFSGYIGVEYEGQKQTEEEGIKLTKALLQKFL